MKSVQMYFGNLREGGILNYATTFIEMLPKFLEEAPLRDYEVIDLQVSEELNSLLLDDSLLRDSRVRLTVRTDRILRPRPRLGSRRKLYDVGLTFSAPEYRGARVAEREVAGFADDLILRASDIKAPTPRESHRLKLKRAVQRSVLKKYDAFFTESLLMQSRLLNLFPNKDVIVVPNGPSIAFYEYEEANLKTPLSTLRSGEGLVFFYPARGYPHKNHRLLRKVLPSLQSELGVPVRLLVTLRPEELVAVGLCQVPGVVNLGERPHHEMPDLYAQCDAVLFPSLRETSSVTPLEAMLMKRPLFASNRDFVRSDCAEYARYFEPLDVADLNNQIREWVRGYRHGLEELAYEWAMRRPSPLRRSESVVQLLW